MATLRARAAILSRIRTFFAQRDVIEVQTPTLGRASVTDPQIESLRTADGAYLQTSPEHYMKRLLAAGAPSIYQLGPVYRAGEQGRLHAEEFTMLEWYRLGFDDQALMDEVAALVDLILGAVPYQRRTYQSLAGALEGDQAALDLRFATAIEQLDAERCFVTDFPARQAALARLRETDKSCAARFELIVEGVEVANGYHELTDPVELRTRMAKDNAARTAAGKAVMPPDERLLAAMASGLPACAGVAIGLDRLIMLATGAASLAEAMPFADR